mmetsp:Transcript_13881/g.39017  ORF Transcript_13881/g.39017 Transcript_13881/m.39017 type:complete len:106 (-) Transcript_13881:1090-1407(-)
MTAMDGPFLVFYGEWVALQHRNGYRQIGSDRPTNYERVPKSATKDFLASIQLEFFVTAMSVAATVVFCRCFVPNQCRDGTGILSHNPMAPILFDWQLSTVVVIGK